MSWIWMKIIAGLLFIVLPEFSLRENLNKHPILTLLAIASGLFFIFISVHPLVKDERFSRQQEFELINQAKSGLSPGGDNGNIKCEAPYFDLLNGTMNGVLATATQEEVKELLPCFDAHTPDGTSYNYGGGVYFNDYGYYMYTGNDFIEVRSGFTGKVTGGDNKKSRQEILAKYGQPLNEEKMLYATKYGCLYFNGSRIRAYHSSCKKAEETLY